MIDSLSTWKSEWALVPKTKDDAWQQNIGDYLETRTTAMVLPGLGGTPIIWTFNTANFVSGLSSVTVDPPTGVVDISDAWESAINASTIAVSAGAFIGTSTPATLFSSVASTIFDVSSIALGKAKILELLASPNVKDALDSEFPVKLNEAWLLLTVTTTGTNSVVPPGGPNPLTDPARAVA